ncbi:MAG: radical SAM protein [Nitrospirae bacterium]|nr:radical SAM protein [Nitrospirota bacterium]
MMYSPLRHTGSIFYKRRPIHLTFFITRRCNAGCPFCFYLKNTPPIPPLARGGEGGVDKSPELSIDEIHKISLTMGNLLWLAFSGGEIYLRDDLVEISRIFYKNNKPSIMLYPTNGMLPEVIKDKTEQILKHCKKSVIAVKLSIDGLNGSHDELRNTLGSFDKTMQTYRLLRELINKYPNFELGVNTVFCSKNQNSMDEIIDFVKGLKNIKTHTISMIRGELLDESYKEVDYLKYLRAIERLENNLKNRDSSVYRFKGARLKAAQDIIQRQLIYRTMLEHKRLIPCYAGRLNLVLTENGDVYPCEMLNEGFGNIRDNDYDMERVIQSKRAREVVNSIIKNRCYCTHECYFMTNILFNPRMYPALAKEYLQL